MHKPKCMTEKETCKNAEYFEIQTDHIIPTRKPDQRLIETEKDLSLN